MKSTWLQWVLGLAVMVLFAAMGMLWQQVEGSLELGRNNQVEVRVVCERTAGIKESLGRIESTLVSVSRKLDDHMLGEIKNRVNKE
jgi:hypothetical protein